MAAREGQPYAVVLGEALVDLLEDVRGGQRVYREAIGGAPLNVAVGLARLGAAVELVGSVGGDALGRRVRAFLAEAGVGTGQLVTAAVPTTIALTTFEGAEPDFHFYGEPPSYAALRPEHLDTALVAGARALYCGSIALLAEPVRAAARLAWEVAPGGGRAAPLRAFDPNVRPRLVADPAELRPLVEGFAGTADLVKLSAADADAMYGLAPPAAARHLAAVGARTVVVTLGARGALVRHGGEESTVPPTPVEAVDATGAGDAMMAGLLYGLLAAPPVDLAGWVDLVGFAGTVAALTCRAPGGATAMPTLAEVTALGRRYPRDPRADSTVRRS
jgi:fructokinase